MKKVCIPILLTLLSATFLCCGCGRGQVTIEKGKLLMMGNENIGFLEIEDGKPTGFSADLAREMAKRLDLSLEVKTLPFSELFAHLEAGDCDMVMSAVTITLDRLAQMDFSDPYFDSGQAILVPIDSPIASEQDLAGRTVGVLHGSTNQKKAEGIEGIGEIVRFEGKPEMFDSLVAGELDAVIVDTPFARYNAKQTGVTKVARVLSTGEQYAIAVRKGNSKLLDGINGTLADLVKDGTYDRLYEKYFGPRI